MRIFLMVVLVTTKYSYNLHGKGKICSTRVYT